MPYVGLATAYVPGYLPWLLVVAGLGGALALFSWTRRRGRIAAALVVVSLLTIVGGSVVNARMTAAVEHAGADIDFIETFGVGQPKSARPDAEATYTNFDGVPLQLSIYAPARSSRDSRAPVLVFIHGGGWIGGDRSANSDDLRWFADQGWLAISVDYALSSEDRHLWDVTQPQIGCALAWLADNVERYGGDPARLSLSGDSAGGNLAINAGFMAAGGTLTSSCGGRIPTIGAVSALVPGRRSGRLLRQSRPRARQLRPGHGSARIRAGRRATTRSAMRHRGAGTHQRRRPAHADDPRPAPIIWCRTRGPMSSPSSPGPPVSRSNW